MTNGDVSGREVEAVAVRAEVVLQCASPREAQVLWGALSADDPGSVEGRVEGDRLVILAGPSPMASLRTTLDDLLACFCDGIFYNVVAGHLGQYLKNLKDRYSGCKKRRHRPAEKGNKSLTEYPA